MGRFGFLEGWTTKRLVLIGAAVWLALVPAGGAFVLAAEWRPTPTGPGDGAVAGALAGGLAGCAMLFVPMILLLVLGSFGNGGIRAADMDGVAMLLLLLAVCLGGLPGAGLGAAGGVIAGGIIRLSGTTLSGVGGGAGFGALAGAIGIIPGALLYAACGRFLPGLPGASRCPNPECRSRRGWDGTTCRLCGAQAEPAAPADPGHGEPEQTTSPEAGSPRS